MNLNETALKLISKMDWGFITPEFSNGVTDTIVHVFNHCLTDEKSINRAIRFTIGRIVWYNTYLMCFLHHEIVFDDIGQNIGDNIIERITNALTPFADSVVFTSKRR